MSDNVASIRRRVALPLIRRATLSDAHEACELVRRSIVELCVDDHHDDQDTLAEWLANKTETNFRSSISSDRHIALVAPDASGIAGFGLLKVTGELARLYVAPEWRFRGVSKAILSALEREAIQLGLEVITLQSTVNARRFYQSCGFVSAGPPNKGFGVTEGYPMLKRI